MFRAIWQNRRDVKRREEELKLEIKEKYGDEKLEITKEDILAMIIAAFQVFAPVILFIAGAFALFIWFFTKVYLK